MESRSQMPGIPKSRKKRASTIPFRDIFWSQEHSFFLKLSREILQGLSLDGILRQIVEKAPLFLKADGCILYLLNEKEDLLEVVQKYNVGRGFSTPLNPEEGKVSALLRGARATVVPDIAKDPSFGWREEAKREGFISAICAPLRTEKPIGLLMLLRRKSRRSGTKEDLLLETLAAHVAAVIENARSQERIHRRLEEMSLSWRNEKKTKDFLEDIINRLFDPILVTDIHGKITFASKGVEEFFGYSQEELVGKRISDFYSGGKEEAKKIMKILGEENSLRNYETEFMTKGGETFSFILSASLLRDLQGNPVGTLGVGKNITEYKKLINHLIRTEESYQKLFDAVNDAIFSINREGCITTFNRMFLKMTGYTEKEIKSFHVSRIIHPEDAPAMIHDYQKVMRGEYAPERHTFRLINKGERVIYVEGNFRRLEEKSEVVGILSVLRDVTEKIKLERELLELSITDGLTGLHNQRHFFNELSREMERARRQRTTLSLLLFDLDDFKAYNDLNGHLEGDKVLRSVAEALLKSIRKMDSAYRYGGDEFTVVLPGAGKEEAVQVAERIRKSFKTLPYLQQMDLSIGLVEFDPQYDLTAFIQHADEAMYCAKKMGGNRISLYPINR
jgi:diguanylate cyclase (GGDEF)-like protein/PAS domain S-box-containing protein